MLTKQFDKDLSTVNAHCCYSFKLLEDNTKATMEPVFWGVAHLFCSSVETSRREDQGFCLFVLPHLKLQIMSASSVISRLR